MALPQRPCWTRGKHHFSRLLPSNYGHAQRSKDQSPTSWAEEVCKCFLPLKLTLCSYGGAELPIVGQVSCSLSKGSFCIKSLLQVQQNAPVDLLLGTDTLPHLGFSLTEEHERTATDNSGERSHTPDAY
jgi:hypothetical protein